MILTSHQPNFLPYMGVIYKASAKCARICLMILRQGMSVEISFTFRKMTAVLSASESPMEMLRSRNFGIKPIVLIGLFLIPKWLENSNLQAEYACNCIT